MADAFKSIDFYAVKRRRVEPKISMGKFFFELYRPSKLAKYAISGRLIL